MSFARWSCACLMVFSCTSLARGETVEEIEKKLVEAHGKLKSYTSDVRTTQNIEMAPGQKMSVDYSGKVEWKRDGDKQKFRTEMKGTTSMGDAQKMDVTLMMICDGDHLYTVSTQMGQTSAMKQKPDTSATGDPKKLFEKIRAENEVKIVGEEKVDGHATYVLEVTPKQADPGPIAKSKMFFAKDTGINIKVLGFGKDGKEVFSNASTNIKLNPDISNDRFVFKAPEGVQVMDMTSGTP